MLQIFQLEFPVILLEGGSDRLEILHDFSNNFLLNSIRTQTNPSYLNR
jgi:hypothetical protein